MSEVGFNNNAGNNRVTPIPGSSRQNEPSSSQATQRRSYDDDVDHGWAFVIMIVSFVIHFIIDGVCLSFGVFYIDLLDEFKDEAVSKILMVGSISLGMYMFVGPLVGGLTVMFGCRVVTIAGSVIAAVSIALTSLAASVDILLIVYGVLPGIGFGMMYLPSIVMVSFYFRRRRAFATGVTVCGTGIGMMVCSPVLNYLMETYGWRRTCWILGAFALNGVPCGMCYRPLPSTGGIYIPFTCLVHHAMLRTQCSEYEAAFLNSILGFSNTIGRLICGYLSDLPRIDCVLFHNLTLLIAGAITCFLPLFNSYGLVAFYSIIYGPTIAVFITLKSILIVDLLGLEQLTSSFGLTILFDGAVVIIGSPLSGALFDRSQSYTDSFILAGVFLIVGALICLPLRSIKRWVAKRRQRTNELSPGAGNSG